MINQNDWTWLARYFAGECSAEEAAEVRRWLEEDPERRRLVDELGPAWDVAAAPSTTWDTPASWQRLAARLRTRERRATVALVQPWASGLGRFNAWWAAAAAAMVVLVAGGLLWRLDARRSTPAVATMREVRTVPTQRTIFRLADGSRIALAPGSVLRYDPARFGRPTRNVYLEGRAYFEVVHDRRHPFFVRTARTVTEDLGTEFVVTDYPKDFTTEVAVLSGMVTARRIDGGQDSATTLMANEVVRFDSAGMVTVESDVDLTSRRAWTEGRLVFDGAPVLDVVRDLNLWYGLNIRLSDPSLAEQQFSANYTTEPDSVVIRELATAIGARVERHGTVVTLVR